MLRISEKRQGRLLQDTDIAHKAARGKTRALNTTKQLDRKIEFGTKIYVVEI